MFDLMCVVSQNVNWKVMFKFQSLLTTKYVNIELRLETNLYLY